MTPKQDYEQLTIQKVLTITMTLVISVVSICFINTLLGNNYLLLDNELSLPVWIFGILKSLSFLLQLIILTMVILDEYSRKIIVLCIIYTIGKVIIEAACAIPAFLFSGCLVIAFIIVLSIYFKKFNKILIKRGLVVCGVICAYQVIALIVKIGMFYFEYNHITQYQYFITSIDLLVFLGVIFAIGGENYVLGLVKRRREYILFPEEVENPQDDSEDLAAEEALKKLTGFKRLKAVLLLLGFQFFQWGLILFICALGNVFIESLVITISFVIYGCLLFKRHWHSQSIILCTLLSILLFYAAAKITPAFKYTQILPIIIGLVLIYSLYRVDVYVKEHHNLKAKLQERQNEKNKLIRGCSKQYILDLSENKGILEWETKLLISKYVNKDKDVKIQREFSISNVWRTIKNIKEKYNLV